MTAAMIVTAPEPEHKPLKPALLLPLLDLAGADAGAAFGAPAASMLSGSGCCCGAHCALGRVAGMVPSSSSQPWIMLLAVGGTSACVQYNKSNNMLGSKE
jgi:hypothetical protein